MKRPGPLLIAATAAVTVAALWAGWPQALKTDEAVMGQALRILMGSEENH